MGEDGPHQLQQSSCATEESHGKRMSMSWPGAGGSVVSIAHLQHPAVGYKTRVLWMLVLGEGSLGKSDKVVRCFSYAVITRLLGSG